MIPGAVACPIAPECPGPPEAVRCEVSLRGLLRLHDALCRAGLSLARVEGEGLAARAHFEVGAEGLRLSVTADLPERRTVVYASGLMPAADAPLRREAWP